MDFPNVNGLPTHINTFMSLGVGRGGRGTGAITAGPSSGAWASANLAIYYPLFLPWRYPVARAFWTNGATVASGHADIGIYSPGGGKVWSAGSTAQAGTNALQYVTANFVLDPGWWYLGFSLDLTTSHAFGATSSAGTGRLTGLLQQATALPLPASATFAAYSQSANVDIELCGITRTASGF